MTLFSSIRARGFRKVAGQLHFRHGLLAVSLCALGCSASGGASSAPPDPGADTGGALGNAGTGPNGGASGSTGSSGSMGTSGSTGASGSGADAGASGSAGASDGGASGNSASGASGAAGTGALTGGAAGTSGGAAGNGASGAAGMSGSAGKGGAAGSGASGAAGMSGTGAGGSAGKGGAAGTSGTGAGGSGGNVGPDPSTTTRMICSGTDPIECHFGGNPGNYDVTVVLGGSAAASTTTWAETVRSMLKPVATGAGQTQRFTFTVNVRQPEGQPIENVPAGTPGLDLYFGGSNGSAPLLQSIGYAAATKPFMIYIAGDSTVCDQSPDTGAITAANPAYSGWGQQVPVYFDYPVSVANYADSGESSGSFLGSGSLFGAITSRLKTGDYVFIQFGHNDKDTTATAFHDNMTKLVTGVKAKGGIPILFTPVARSTFDSTTKMLTPQHINSTGANLPDIIKTVATEQNVTVLDLLASTITWNNQIGPNGWKQYHALGTDMTHFNQAGATIVAGFVHDLIVQAQLSALTSHMRP